VNRRMFLMSLVATASGLLIPDWGQRVFPMFPRIKRNTIEQFLNYPGYRWVLELPPDRMRAMIARWVREPGAHYDGGMVCFRRSACQLENEGWKMELKDGCERLPYLEKNVG